MPFDNNTPVTLPTLLKPPISATGNHHLHRKTKVMEDPGIKLFGKKIMLPEISKSINNSVIFTTTAVSGEDATGGGDGKDGGSDHTYLERERVTREGAEKEQLKANYSETGTDESEPEQQNPQPKTLKKPDKILPCPRCTSMDTKFCYFNNYNVNQPRHFCKSCQRYWTAGGAMRNMPVGAGRRKNKNSNSIPSFDSVLEKIQEKNPPHFKISKTHCIPKVSWPNNLRNSIPIPIPPVCPSMPVYPSTYWNCIPFLPPLTNASGKILGKHSRDELLIKSNDCDSELKKRKNLILIPKTLRIDDPDEAAKSSIWASLGIKNDNFMAFQEKGEETKKHQAITNSSVLHANPAAFSRSICFQETM